MVNIEEILNKTSKKSKIDNSITVKKHLEVDLDLGMLLACDPNVLDNRLLQSNVNDHILKLTRENTQLLFNKIWELPTAREEEAIVAKLPRSKFILPRSKTAPKAKPLTKWEKFAKEKGIQKKKKTKLTWDEQLKKWIPRYGFRKALAEQEKNWVIEVPQNSNPNEDQFAKRTAAKQERVAKNEMQRLRNVARAKNVKVPRFGVLDPSKSSSKDLQTAVTVARSSTASVGKFQQKLPHEKEARGIAHITPGAASRKRKLPPVPGDQERSQNLEVIESLLNKRPKIDVDNIVSKRIHENQLINSQNNSKQQRKRKNKPQKSNKKPSSGKGQRKGKSGGGGRKRR